MYDAHISDPDPWSWHMHASMMHISVVYACMYDACMYDPCMMHKYDAHISDADPRSFYMHVSMMHMSVMRLKFYYERTNKAILRRSWIKLLKWLFQTSANTALSWLLCLYLWFCYRSFQKITQLTLSKKVLCFSLSRSFCKEKLDWNYIFSNDPISS